MIPARITPENGWDMVGVYPHYTAYQKGDFCALSGVHYVEDEHQPAHWEWLLSFSHASRRRLTNNEVSKCLRDLGAEYFQEDNHEPGIARKFWLAVEEKYRVPCPCKDELVITEGDYQYSVKKDEVAK